MIVLAHSGKQHSYHVAKTLHDLDALEMFHTSGYACSFLQKVSKLLPGNPLQRRYLENLDTKKVKPNWHFEFRENFIRQVLRNPSLAREAVYQRDVNFDFYLSKKLEKSSASHYWGFQGSSQLSLISAKKNGIKAICELATAHVTSAKKILGEEQKLHPNWAHTIDNLVFPGFYEKRLEEEPHEANHIIAASAFTKQSLIDQKIPDQKITLLPLGFDSSRIPFEQNYFESKIATKPLKLLYAGRVTQRKGILYLLESLRTFNPQDVELHIIGQINGADSLLKPYKSYIHLHGPKTQSELFNEYRNYDALVLPSLFEGFGLVLVEAMAAGLPVIATPNTMAPEVVKNHINGFIVPIRNVDSLKTTIEHLMNLNPEEYLKLRISAHKSANDYSWSNYKKRLSLILNQL